MKQDYYENYNRDGSVTESGPMSVRGLPLTSTINQYYSQPNTSKGKVWLEHKGKRVYLTTHSRTSQEWNVQGLKYPMRLSYQGWMPPKDGEAKWKYTDRNETFEYGQELSFALNRTLLKHKDLELQYNKNELLTLAHADANEATFDLGTFLGELPETLQFLGSIVLKLISIFRSIKTGKIFKDSEKYFRKGYVKRLADDTSDAWLAYRYAIMPLIYSLEDGIASLSPPEAVFLRTRKRTSEEQSLEEPFDYVAQFGKHHAISVSYHREMIARAQVYTILTAEQASKRNRLLGPFTTAWELVPLSFVVDWVFQVGDFIASFRMLPYQSQGTTYSVSDNIQVVASALPFDAVDKNYYGGDEISALSGNQNLGYSYRSYDRTVVNSFTHEIPVGIRMNICRYIDAFTLSFKIGQKAIKRRH